MSLRALGSGDALGGGRGNAVVVVPAVGSTGALNATLRLLLAHTGEGVPIVVTASESYDVAEIEASDRVSLLALGAQGGVAAGLAAVHARAPHTDLALVRPGVLVAAGWLEGLRDAALSDSIVMTSSPLSEPLAQEQAVEDCAAAVRSASGARRPTLAAAREACCYVRASALELVGPPDPSTADSQAVAELSERISALALVHVLADDVCVGAEQPAVALAQASAALRRAVAVAETSLRPLSVTVDARALGIAATGTRTYILDLIAALAREDSLRLRVVLPPDTSDDVLAVLEADPAIELISYDDAVAGVPLTDVVHRPQQVFTADDLTLLRLLGERVVITHHDLISYRCGAYHASLEAWQDYRRVTRLALAAADMVVFSSRHARDDALREDLIPAPRARVVPDGADRVWPQPPLAPLRPEGVPEQGLLVCIGVDYAHKNRPFALALARALHERHGWEGKLVLAGPHAQRGSSRERERAMLDADAVLAGLVVDIGPVEDAGRAWLYAHAQAVVYPSVYEGFGLVPFEAAQAGVPCLYAPTAALGELAGPDVAKLVPWDAQASADAVAPLLQPGAAREDHVRVLREAAAAMSWARCVPLLRAVYDEALASPWRASAPRVAEELERESHIVALAASAEHDRARASELALANDEAQRANAEAQRGNEDAQRANEQAQQALAALRSSVGAFADHADGGQLTAAQRRGLLRVLSRPALRTVLLAPFALAGRGTKPQGGGEED